MSKDSTTSTLGDESGTQVQVGNNEPKPVDTTTQQKPAQQKAARGTGRAQTEAQDGPAPSGAKRKISIAPARDENDEEFVFVGVNARGFQIPRGQVVEVPQEVVDALNNAVETRYDKNGTPRTFHRYQFQVHE